MIVGCVKWPAMLQVAMAVSKFCESLLFFLGVQVEELACELGIFDLVNLEIFLLQRNVLK